MSRNLSNAALCRVSYHAFVNVTKIVTEINAECIYLLKISLKKRVKISQIWWLNL